MNDEINNSLAEDFMEKGHEFFARNKFPQALEMFSTAVSICENEEYYIECAKACEKLGKVKSGLYFTEKAIAQNGSTFNSWLLKARFLKQAGDFEGASQILENCIQRWPEKTNMCKHESGKFHYLQDLFVEFSQLDESKATQKLNIVNELLSECKQATKFKIEKLKLLDRFPGCEEESEKLCEEIIKENGMLPEVAIWKIEKYLNIETEMFKVFDLLRQAEIDSKGRNELTYYKDKLEVYKAATIKGNRYMRCQDYQKAIKKYSKGILGDYKFRFIEKELICRRSSAFEADYEILNALRDLKVANSISPIKDFELIQVNLLGKLGEFDKALVILKELKEKNPDKMIDNLIEEKERAKKRQFSRPLKEMLGLNFKMYDPNEAYTRKLIRWKEATANGRKAVRERENMIKNITDAHYVLSDESDNGRAEKFDESLESDTLYEKNYKYEQYLETFRSKISEEDFVKHRENNRVIWEIQRPRYQA
jgi:tetratricopeptide (TPR) repeat protein